MIHYPTLLSTGVTLGIPNEIFYITQVMVSTLLYPQRGTTGMPDIHYHLHFTWPTILKNQSKDTCFDLSLYDNLGHSVVNYMVAEEVSTTKHSDAMDFLQVLITIEWAGAYGMRFAKHLLTLKLLTLWC